MNFSKAEMKRYVYTNSISKIECCPFEQASDLIAVALESSIQIEGLKIKEQEVIEKCNIKGYQIGSKVTSLTWSPISVSRIINGRFEATISLAASFEDNSIYVFLNNEADDLTKHLRKRSLGWFNQINYDHTGELLASIGDDKYCRIWNVTVENNMVEYPIEFKLESKGVSVNFNQHSPGQFLTAEESGSIKLYDLDSKSVIRTLNSPLSSAQILTSIAWNPKDPELIGGIIGSKWYIWCLTEIAVNIEQEGHCHSSGSKLFKWSSVHPRMFAIGSLDPYQKTEAVKVFPNSFTKVPFSFSLQSKASFRDFSWCASSSIMFLVGGNQLVYYPIQ